MLKFGDVLNADTISDLQGAGDFNDGQIAVVKGDSSALDGGAAVYYWDDDSTTTDDSATDATVIQVTGQTTGRWIKMLPDSPTVTGGTVGTASSGTIAVKHSRVGTAIKSTFTLTAAQVAVTDADASGSYGTLKLFDFPEGGISFLGCRQNYTAFAEGAALTGEAGDAEFEIGLGTTAISAAADGTLGDGAQENIGQAISVTLSGGTGTGTVFDPASTAVDGTATALDLNLNVSGTAATIDATSTLDVTGTITVVWLPLGDD